MTIIRNFKKAEQPLEFIKVENTGKYFDLFLNKGANGKAIRISNRDGQSVNVSLDKVSDLITALTEVKNKGVKTSVNSLPNYNRF